MRSIFTSAEPRRSWMKPTIGDAIREIEPEDIRRTNRLMNRTAWICEILCLGILIAVAV